MSTTFRLRVSVNKLEVCVQYFHRCVSRRVLCIVFSNQLAFNPVVKAFFYALQALQCKGISRGEVADAAKGHLFEARNSYNTSVELPIFIKAYRCITEEKAPVYIYLNASVL